jgi:hypothetical protein
MDLVLFLIRLVVGGLLASHGFQKLFGWLGGFGFAGTGAYLESHGFRHGRAFAALVVAVVSAGVVLASRGRPMPAAASDYPGNVRPSARRSARAPSTRRVVGRVSYLSPGDSGRTRAPVTDAMPSSTDWSSLVICAPASQTIESSHEPSA